MISTSVPTVPVVPHIPFIPFVLKIPAVLSVSFVSDVSRELICTGRTSCTLGTDDTLDTFGVKTGFYGTEEIFGAKNSLLWYATHFQRGVLSCGNVLGGTKSQCCMVSWSVVGA